MKSTHDLLTNLKYFIFIESMADRGDQEKLMNRENSKIDQSDEEEGCSERYEGVGN